MRNIWRIFRDDVRLAVSNIVSVLVLLGLCLVPVMYAWFNIAASWDPYSNTDQLKVAVANNDEGFESDLVSTKVNVGDRVVQALRDNHDYGWVFVDDADAMDGVNSGRYYAAMIIPADFSSQMMSVFSSDAKQASVDFYLNMKENPIAPVLAGEGGAEVVQDICVKFNESVDSMALDLASDIVEVAKGDKVQDLGAVLAARLNSASDDLVITAQQVRSYASLAASATALTDTTASALSGTGEAAADGAASAGESALDVANRLQGAVSSAQEAVAVLQADLESGQESGKKAKSDDELVSKLAADTATLAGSVQRVAQDAASASSSVKAVVAGLSTSTESLSADMQKIQDELNRAAEALESSARALQRFRSDVSMAIENGDLTEVAKVIGSNPSSLAEWLAAPVQVEKHAVYPVANYGSSMAPFYTILSIWVGAVVLVALMKTGISEGRLRRYESEAGRPLRNYEQYLGRYLSFAALSLVQATIACVGDIAFLRVQCVSPLLFLVACWACALVFSSIVYTFAISFGEVGKALCIIMLVMQVAGSGGEYPVQMMSGFFQAVYPFLPFTHGIHAMQASIAGVYGSEFAVNIGLLLAFLVPSLFLGLVIRRPVIRFANFFDAKLKETGLM